MKILKVLGGIMLLLIVAFFLIGVISPKTTYENSVTVNKPADVAWDVFTDEDKMDEWLVGVQGIEPLEGEPLTAGSRFKLIFNLEGERMEITEEVTRIKENELFAFLMESDPLISEVEIRFEPLDSAKTQIIAVTTAEGNGLLWKPVISISGSVMQQQAQLSYDNLKQLIESHSDTSDVSSD